MCSKHRCLIYLTRYVCKTSQPPAGSSGVTRSGSQSGWSTPVSSETAWSNEICIPNTNTVLCIEQKARFNEIIDRQTDGQQLCYLLDFQSWGIAPVWSHSSLHFHIFTTVNWYSCFIYTSIHNLFNLWLYTLLMRFGRHWSCIFWMNSQLKCYQSKRFSMPFSGCWFHFFLNGDFCRTSSWTG